MCLKHCAVYILDMKINEDDFLQKNTLVKELISNKCLNIPPLSFLANTTDLKRKGGGIRPIADGDTSGRIVYKCIMRHTESLLAHQSGYGSRAICLDSISKCFRQFTETMKPCARKLPRARP